ncbi:unnamed protein product [Pseudo-nitzschia multistriata]|uniref:Serine aminopeptidase S33 domain-containing protein n=1 Tax=Pseudo-nitzschia multistriata TaxID=183589 RepID=A0A448YXF8_9STRA|nr:unnamed protein product [Pseudo-nitzschia multistriata]
MPCYNLWDHDGLDIEIPEEIFPDETFRKEKDILFDHPQHGYFESCYQGKKLHYRKNLPPEGTPIRAIVVWQHGIHGHSGYGMKCSDGRFTDMALRIRMMNAKGYAVYSHDLLGHGFSEGERFYIPNGNWKINRDDLINFALLVADNHPEDTPLILSGDSYGGCLAFHAAHVLQTEKPELASTRFLGCALNCPSFHGDIPSLPVTLFLRYGLAPFFPLWTPFFMPHPITPERCWRETEPRAHFTDQSQIHGLSKGGKPFCLGTAVGLLSALQASQVLIPIFCLPFHINHGSDDYGVPLSGSQSCFTNSKTPDSEKELNIVPGGYHCLFSQLDSKSTMQHEIDWIEKKIRGTEK